MKAWLLVLCAVLLQSCAPVIKVDVDSMCAPKAKEKHTYILLPGNQNCAETDLQYQEFAHYTDNVLQDIGFKKASVCEEADVAIFLSYGISDPQLYEYTYSVPIVGQTGVCATSTAGINRCGNNAYYSSTTSYTPTYGVIGSKTEVGTGVIFERGFSLTGIDAQTYKECEVPVEIWKTKAISIGQSGDLRTIFPVMLVATQNHIAGSTGGIVSYTLREDDKRVKKIKSYSY